MKKNTKNIIYWIVGLTFIIVVVVLGSKGIGENGGKGNAISLPNVYSASTLSATDEVFDFGTISMKEGKVSHQFEIKNEGEEPIIIEKVYTSCMCTVAYITDASGEKYGEFGMPGHNSVSSKTSIEIKAGETASLEAVFDTKAHGPSGVGLAQRSIYIETNSSNSPKLELRFQAMVTQ